MRRPTRRQIVAGAAGAVLLMLLLPALATVVISATTRGLRFGPGQDIPARAVALVLGAGVQPDGTPSWALERRIDVAAELYRRGLVRALLMSGDHGTAGYDEVEAMSRAAQARGVPPSAIVTDHAGFDTFSSCYRARHVFGVRRAVVISQGWHLPRAVWLCRQEGIDAVGAASAGGDASVDQFGSAREFPANLKALIDAWTGRTPRFPGPVEHSLDAVNAAG